MKLDLPAGVELLGYERCGEVHGFEVKFKEIFDTAPDRATADEQLAELRNARVITKRCYGVKSAGTLLSRLILDLNRASETVGRRLAGET